MSRFLRQILPQVLFLSALDWVVKARNLPFKPTFSGLKSARVPLLKAIKQRFSAPGNDAGTDFSFDECDDLKVVRALGLYNKYLEYLNNLFVAHLMLKQGQLIQYSFSLLKAVGKAAPAWAVPVDFFEAFALSALRETLQICQFPIKGPNKVSADKVFGCFVPLFNFLLFANKSQATNLHYLEAIYALLAQLKAALREYPLLVSTLQAVLDYFSGQTRVLAIAPYLQEIYNTAELSVCMLFLSSLKKHRLPEQGWTHLLSSSRLHSSAHSQK